MRQVDRAHDEGGRHVVVRRHDAARRLLGARHRRREKKQNGVVPFRVSATSRFASPFRRSLFFVATREMGPLLCAALVAASGVAPASDFRMRKFACVDHGAFEAYCPGRTWIGNRGYAPTRDVVRVKNERFVPTTRREEDDAIGLRFEYVLVCVEYTLFGKCAQGDVTMHIRPTPKWDKEVSWVEWIVETVVVTAVCVLLGPFLLFAVIVLGLCGGGSFKERSFFSDD